MADLSEERRLLDPTAHRVGRSYTNVNMHSFVLDPKNQDGWIEHLRARGVECHLHAFHHVSKMSAWSGGKSILATELNLAHQNIRMTPRIADALEERHVFVKIVRSGCVHFEQSKTDFCLHRGDIVIFDSSKGFSDTYQEPAEVVAFKISAETLRMRGGSPVLPNACRFDGNSPDVQALAKMLVASAGSSVGVSPAVQTHLEDHALELVTLFMMSSDRGKRLNVSRVTMSRVKGVVRARLADPLLDAKALAEDLHVSVSQLSRELAKCGTSPMRLAWEMRTEHAAALLQVSQLNPLSVADIAARTGFTSNAHFSRAFKKRFGMSPSEFRAMNNTSSQ